MPVKNFSFVKDAPRLWVKIINTQKNKESQVLAKLDSGAGACFFPMAIAKDLDLELDPTDSIDVKTVGKKTTGYSGTVDINILSFNDDYTASNKVLRLLKERKVYFVEDGSFHLLGSKGCLENFILVIHYPEKTFSLRDHKKLDCPCHP